MVGLIGMLRLCAFWPEDATLITKLYEASRLLLFCDLFMSWPLQPLTDIINYMPNNSAMNC